MAVTMALAQISPNSILANPSHVNPQARTDQTTAAPQVNQDAQKAVQAVKTDTVTISQHALQKLANDRYVATKESYEKASEKASETLRGRK